MELRRLLAGPYWKYLGFKSEDAVRAVFREADAAGILGKYVVADQLEQIPAPGTITSTPYGTAHPVVFRGENRECNSDAMPLRVTLYHVGGSSTSTAGTRASSARRSSP